MSACSGRNKLGMRIFLFFFQNFIETTSWFKTAGDLKIFQF